jgi:hypothetical protein
MVGSSKTYVTSVSEDPRWRIIFTRCAVERQVAKADLRERLEAVLQGAEQGRDRRFLQAGDPLGQVADLHRTCIGDVDPVHLRRAGRLGEPGAVAIRAGREGDRPLDERADVRLERFDVLGQELLLDLRDQTLVGEVHAVDLDLGGLLVEQVAQLLLVELADRLVGIEEAGALEDASVPAVHAVAGDGDRAFVERPAVVVQLSEVDVVDAAHAFAARAHAADAVVGRLHRLLVAALDRDPAASANRGDVERKRAGRADVRLAEAAEEDAQHRVGVGDGADRGPRVGTHPLLVDDDRCRQPFENVDLGAGQGWHEALHERAVGLVDQPLRLRGDRAEHE